MTALILDWRRKDGLTWLDWEAAGVRAAFPAREGGVSTPPYASLNLGLSVGDEPADVLENRRRLAETLGLPIEPLVVPAQVHGTRLGRWTSRTRGVARLSRLRRVADTDALLTATPGPRSRDQLRRLRAGRHRRRRARAARCSRRCTPAGGACSPASSGRRPRQLARRGRLLARRRRPEHRALLLHRRREPARAASRRGSRGRRARPTVDLWACARQELVAAGVPARAASPSRASARRATRASSPTAATTA